MRLPSNLKGYYKVDVYIKRLTYFIKYMFLVPANVDEPTYKNYRVKTLVMTSIRDMLDLHIHLLPGQLLWSLTRQECVLMDLWRWVLFHLPGDRDLYRVQVVSHRFQNPQDPHVLSVDFVQKKLTLGKRLSYGVREEFLHDLAYRVLWFEHLLV